MHATTTDDDDASSSGMLLCDTMGLTSVLSREGGKVQSEFMEYADEGFAVDWENSRHVAFVKGVPEENPTGEIAWSDPYWFEWGSMITVVAPLYIHTDSNGDVSGVLPPHENAEYFGLVASDILLSITEYVLTDLLVTESGFTFISNYDGFMITATQAAIDAFFNEGTALSDTIGQSIKVLVVPSFLKFKL